MSAGSNQIADAGQQFVFVERFGEVIVCARIQTLDARLGPGPGGQEDHRDRAQCLITANRFQQIIPAHPGHHGIREDQIRAQGFGLLQALGPILGQGDAVLTVQHPLHIGSHVRVILGHEHQGKSAGRGRRGDHRSIPFFTGLMDEREQGDLLVLDRHQVGKAGSPARQGDREGRTLAKLALHRDPSPVEVHNLFDQCQADPGPLVAARSASFHLSEAVKDPFQLIVRDADPVVFDLQLDPVFIRAQPHPHLPLLWIAELEGVGEQVIEDLLHLERVGCNRDRLLHPSGMDTAPCTRVKVGRDAPDDGSEIDASLLQFRAPALKLGQVQQFVDEKQEPGRIPQARLNQLPALRGWRKFEESLVRAQAERQRGAELMTDIGEKLRL